MSVDEDNQNLTADNLSLAGLEDLPTIESAIKLRLQKLADLKDKQKKLNEMLKSYLENSDEYREATKIAKDAGAKKAGIKRDLLSKPEAQDLPMKLDEAKAEKADLSESLSYYLSQFAKLTGTTEFEDENGELKKIVYVAKLVKR